MIGTQCICYLYANVHSALPRPGRLLVHSHKSAVWQVNHHTQREKRGERRKVNWMEWWKKGKWRQKKAWDVTIVFLTTYFSSPQLLTTLFYSIHLLCRNTLSVSCCCYLMANMHKGTYTCTNTIKHKTTAHTHQESKSKNNFQLLLI